jgi:hypothetical protein
VGYAERARGGRQATAIFHRYVAWYKVMFCKPPPGPATLLLRLPYIFLNNRLEHSFALEIMSSVPMASVRNLFCRPAHRWSSTPNTAHFKKLYGANYLDISQYNRCPQQAVQHRPRGIGLVRNMYTFPIRKVVVCGEERSGLFDYTRFCSTYKWVAVEASTIPHC